MENKLGLGSYKINDVEKKIVNLKLNLIDEYFTFNETDLEFDYLEKINKFLFNDFYKYEEVDYAVKKIINKYLIILNDICINESENIETILEIINSIWIQQPFKDGNTRTLLAYSSVLNKAYTLGLNIDLNKEIESGTNTFKLENFVNQKRLTK